MTFWDRLPPTEVINYHIRARERPMATHDQTSARLNDLTRTLTPAELAAGISTAHNETERLAPPDPRRFERLFEALNDSGETALDRWLMAGLLGMLGFFFVFGLAAVIAAFLSA